ncbi:hypothetical protein ALQ48_02984 [Pseudomonas coronafaciens pv. zizaniae]|nr:Uncharacterized protein AC511_3801 [Pseudomonas coronafaciens pv. oryzae]RMO09735.1 hypothetical protein ALQ48_02984 [Pseudomonas coronafaciens pv. zizaniae]
MAEAWTIERQKRLTCAVQVGISRRVATNRVLWSAGLPQPREIAL